MGLGLRVEGQGSRVEDLGLIAVANPSTINFDWGGLRVWGSKSRVWGVGFTFKG